MKSLSPWFQLLGLAGNAGAVRNAGRACVERRDAESAVEARLSTLPSAADAPVAPAAAVQPARAA